MRWRLVAALLGLTLVVLLVHDIPLANYLRTVETDRIITALERDAFILAGKSSESLEKETAESKASLEKTLHTYNAKSGAQVIVINAKGKVTASSETENAIGSTMTNRPEVATALTGEVASGRRFSQSLNEELLYVAVPVLSGTEIKGVVRITFAANVVDTAVTSRMKGISTVAGITLLLAAFVALVLSSGVTRRLKELEKATEDFALGQHDVRANPHEGAPEIKSLAASFNTMADQINRLLEQQRAFAGDASHQLRTPLTALQLRLERTAELITDDPQAAAERLEAAMEETDRLQRLVEGLLILSRSDAKNVQTQVFDAAIIARERSESWSVLAGESGVDIATDLPKHALVHAVPGALEQIIDNYVDNALEVVPANSTITIRITQDHEFIRVQVQDEGPGMPEPDLDKAFNRFWRARSDKHGSGLGLAIVERLATASGGSVSLRNAQPNGLIAQASFRSANDGTI